MFRRLLVYLNILPPPPVSCRYCGVPVESPPDGRPVCCSDNCASRWEADSAL